jgi:hypothetical protein
MDINIIIFFIIFGLVLGGLIGYAGFRYPPKIKIPSRELIAPPEVISIPNNLPSLLKESLINNFNSQLPLPGSLVAWGRGRIKAFPLPVIGPLWTPFSWTLDLLPSNAFVLQFRMTWFGKVFIIGGDEFRNGHGRFLMGDRLLESDNLNLSEATLMWIYSLWLSPFTLLTNKQINWKGMDESTIQATVPSCNDEFRSFDYVLDPSSNRLLRIDTTRTASRDGRSLAFHADFGQHRLFDDHYTFPAHMSARWENEKPYLHLDLIGLRYNVDVSEVMQQGID